MIYKSQSSNLQFFVRLNNHSVSLKLILTLSISTAPNKYPSFCTQLPKNNKKSAQPLLNPNRCTKLFCTWKKRTKIWEKVSSKPRWSSKPFRNKTKPTKSRSKNSEMLFIKKDKHLTKRATVCILREIITPLLSIKFKGWSKKTIAWSKELECSKRRKIVSILNWEAKTYHR